MNAEPITVLLCTHTKTNGRTCQSPALTGADLCFFHNKLKVSHRKPFKAEALTSFWQECAVASEGDPDGDPGALARTYPRQDEIEFPPLEDAESIQLATSMLFQAIATGQIYFKRARLLLYTLKIAVINQRALNLSRAVDAATPISAMSFRSATEESAPSHAADAQSNHQSTNHHPERSAEGAQSEDPDGSVTPQPLAPFSQPHPNTPEEPAAREPVARESVAPKAKPSEPFETPIGAALDVSQETLIELAASF